MRDRRGERSRRLRRHCVAVDSTRTDNRGQLLLTVVEVIITTLLVLAVVTGFVLAPPASTAESDALARQATDVVPLVGPAPAGGPGTLLGVARGSLAKFDDRAAQLHEVAAAGSLNGAFVSLRTGVGLVRRPLPETTRVRTMTAVVPRCAATLEA